jgi:uncharacterized damage-inducible protein DinB
VKVGIDMETIKSMFEHLDWANQRILVTLQKIDEEHIQANKLFSHILLAENVWFTRLVGKDSSHLPIWATSSLETFVELVKHNNQNFTGFISNLTNTDLSQIVSYKNSKGEEFKNSVREILTHVALHGQYHRGQINQLLRGANTEPINVDFITFKR